MPPSICTVPWNFHLQSLTLLSLDNNKVIFLIVFNLSLLWFLFKFLSILALILLKFTISLKKLTFCYAYSCLLIFIILLAFFHPSSKDLRFYISVCCFPSHDICRCLQTPCSLFYSFACLFLKL